MNEIATRVISQAQLRESSMGWHRVLFRDIEHRLHGDSAFPCVFSKNAFRKELIKFVLVEGAQPSDFHRLALALEDYVDLSRQWEGDIDTAYPLLVAFSHEAVRAGSPEAYHAFGWHVLQRLHALDPAAWPDDVARDPDSDSWSMCFNGMALFCNMSSPAHQVRKSRNLGEHFVLVINPRDRFDVFAGDTPGGRNVRSNIRNRIARYDGSSHALQLGTYGAGGREWWQYGLVEDNVVRTDQCPFLFGLGAD